MKDNIVVDFHTHIFPDDMAERTIGLLSERGRIMPFLNGTLTDLKKSMNEAGISYSIVLPVVTLPEHFENVFKFMLRIHRDRNIIAFGGLHPKSLSYRQELRKIKDAGFKGIKLHPDYQGIYIDDFDCMRVIDYATELGLWISVHSGIDAGFVDSLCCTPKRLKNVLKEVQTDRLILAHMGSWGLWHEVQELLIGEDFYMDTAFCLGRVSEKRMIDMFRGHGIEKILFATDSPWCGQKEEIAALDSMDLTDEEKHMVLGGNAVRILGLEAHDED